ncbi:D-alanyl-D-alanine carboxypeptidase family protein [Natronincola peptidivorans]|nr:D-alanyl-D-alanine carboxypeptidase family protein [Natronincola peptidivorans]
MFKSFFVLLFIALLNPFFVSAQEVYCNGAAGIVLDVETGRVLYEKNIHQELPMASTTKIMTALLAIERIPLDQQVKIHPEAVGVEGSSIYLKANEKVNIIDLLYGLMLRSGNDAATAIAYEVSGSVEDFSQLMNQRAKEIGAKNTNFMNPHGLHHQEHYTTAYDLSMITRAALRNPTFKKIVNTKFWLADREDYKHFSNKNKILSICEGGDGVKIGFTKKAGRCLVASATRNDMQFIAITLNDGDWFNTAKNLLDYHFESYKPYEVFKEGELVKGISVKNGEKMTAQLKASKKLVVPIKDGEAERIISIIDVQEPLYAPLMKNQRVGRILTYLDGNLINITDLTTDEDINKLSIKGKVLRFMNLR